MIVVNGSIKKLENSTKMLDGMLLGPDALDDFKPLIINNTSIGSHGLKKILFSLAFFKNDLF